MRKKRYINKHFASILADVDKYKFPEENPFADAEDTEEVSEDGKTRVASVGYKYRKWDLGSEFLIFLNFSKCKMFSKK